MEPCASGSWSSILDSRRTIPIHFSVTFAPQKDQHRRNRRCLALASSLLLRLLEDLLDDLLLLNQESADNAVLDAASAARATVGTADVLLGAGDLSILAGAESGNLCNRNCQSLDSIRQRRVVVQI